uniref:Uncharacterized protein n=2 Tax=Cacopsylla melanoneura TaxID=428564 RepID=A0A8D8Y279_9HEMI
MIGMRGFFRISSTIKYYFKFQSSVFFWGVSQEFAWEDLDGSWSMSVRSSIGGSVWGSIRSSVWRSIGSWGVSSWGSIWGVSWTGVWGWGVGGSFGGNLGPIPQNNNFPTCTLQICTFAVLYYLK